MGGDGRERRLEIGSAIADFVLAVVLRFHRTAMVGVWVWCGL